MASVNEAVAKHTVSVRIVTDTQTVGRYVPRRVRLRLGQAVRFVNRSIDAHTVTADDESFDSGYLGIGKHWTFLATKVGRFVFHCTYHPAMGGVIVVSP
jgi:plastocyanin